MGIADCWLIPVHDFLGVAMAKKKRAKVDVEDLGPVIEFGCSKPTYFVLKVGNKRVPVFLTGIQCLKNPGSYLLEVSVREQYIPGERNS
jgi:hypothetical protein